MKQNSAEKSFFNWYKTAPKWLISRQVIRVCGIFAANIFAVYTEARKAQKQDEFICPNKVLFDTMLISTYHAKIGKRQLVEAGYISIELKGFPAKEYIKILKEVS